MQALYTVHCIQTTVVSKRRCIPVHTHFLFIADAQAMNIPTVSGRMSGIPDFYV